MSVGTPWEGGIPELLLMLVVFFCILFLAWLVTRIVGKRTMGRYRSKYIEVVDTISIGTDVQLLIVKVVDEFFLVSKSGKQFGFMTKLMLESDYDAVGADSTRPSGFADSFKQILEKQLGYGKEKRSESEEYTSKQPGGNSDLTLKPDKSSGISNGHSDVNTDDHFVTKPRGVFRGNIDKLRRMSGKDE